MRSDKKHFVVHLDERRSVEVPLFEIALVLVRLDHVAGIARRSILHKLLNKCIHEFVDPLVLVGFGS